ARRRLPRAALAVRVRRAAAPLPPALGGVPPPCRLLREPAPPLPGARLETRRLPLYLVRTSGHNGPSPERACRRRARLVRLARTGCGLRQQLRGAPPGRRALPARRPAPSGGVAAARAALAEAPPDPAAVVPLDRPPVEVLAPPRPACGRGQPRGRRRRPAPREALAAAARAVLRVPQRVAPRVHARTARRQPRRRALGAALGRPGRGLSGRLRAGVRRARHGSAAPPLRGGGEPRQPVGPRRP